MPEADTLSDLRRLARIGHALSDETRLSVLALLRDGERCVCDLMAALGAAQSRLSFHLRTLVEAGLIRGRRDGRWVHYERVPGALEGLEASLARLSPGAVVRPVRFQINTTADGDGRVRTEGATHG